MSVQHNVLARFVLILIRPFPFTISTTTVKLWGFLCKKRRELVRSGLFRAHSLDAQGYPPERLTLYPSFVNSENSRSRCSPWISMVPSLIVPPAPQRCLSFIARVLSSCPSRGIPSIIVTPLPLRPFVLRDMRTFPSPMGNTFFRRQVQRFTGFEQSGQIRPSEVE
jgi:hypothetical protein